MVLFIDMRVLFMGVVWHCSWAWRGEHCSNINSDIESMTGSTGIEVKVKVDLDLFVLAYRLCMD